MNSTTSSAHSMYSADFNTFVSILFQFSKSKKFISSQEERSDVANPHYLNFYTLIQEYMCEQPSNGQEEGNSPVSAQNISMPGSYSMKQDSKSA